MPTSTTISKSKRKRPSKIVAIPFDPNIVDPFLLATLTPPQEPKTVVH